jgi:hypothetical protein
MMMILKVDSSSQTLLWTEPMIMCKFCIRLGEYGSQLGIMQLRQTVAFLLQESFNLRQIILVAARSTVFCTTFCSAVILLRLLLG